MAGIIKPVVRIDIKETVGQFDRIGKSPTQTEYMDGSRVCLLGSIVKALEGRDAPVMAGARYVYDYIHNETELPICYAAGLDDGFSDSDAGDNFTFALDHLDKAYDDLAEDERQEVVEQYVMGYMDGQLVAKQFDFGIREYTPLDVREDLRNIVDY